MDIRDQTFQPGIRQVHPGVDQELDKGVTNHCAQQPSTSASAPVSAKGPGIMPLIDTLQSTEPQGIDGGRRALEGLANAFTAERFFKPGRVADQEKIIAPTSARAPRESRGAAGVVRLIEAWLLKESRCGVGRSERLPWLTPAQVGGFGGQGNQAPIGADRCQTNIAVAKPMQFDCANGGTLAAGVDRPGLADQTSSDGSGLHTEQARQSGQSGRPENHMRPYFPAADLDTQTPRRLLGQPGRGVESNAGPGAGCFISQCGVEHIAGNEARTSHRRGAEALLHQAKCDSFCGCAERREFRTDALG
jgi:hypothetical protein